MAWLSSSKATMLWTQRPKLSLASESLITSHHCLLSCTSSPSVNVLFLRFYCTLHGVPPTFPWLSSPVLMFLDELLGLLTNFCWTSQHTSLRPFSCARRTSGIPFHLRLKAAHLSLYLNLSWPIFFDEPVFRLLTFSIFRTFRLLTLSIAWFFILLY